jgi:hypothetical protein
MRWRRLVRLLDLGRLCQLLLLLRLLVADPGQGQQVLLAGLRPGELAC